MCYVWCVCVGREVLDYQGSCIHHTVKKSCTHYQSGLTALKVALSEGHQDVCDILLQHAQQGPKVTSPEREGSESSDEEEAKAELAKVGNGDDRQE